MRIIFSDLNKDVIQALETAFSGVDSVTTFCGDIRDVKGDAIVSPANSYGWMNGGIDAVYLSAFGYQLQVRVQTAIAERYDGFLPVGCALSVHSMGFGPQYPKYLIVSPTMETPGDVSSTKNAYLSFLAALKEARNLAVETLICPGLCSLTGRMPAMEMAKQMRAAFEGGEKIDALQT